jgi:anaerobic ribonucleoside-triphosphate reductase activating protein
MRYHNITKDDMLNGEGLRVVLWLAGCTHRCPGCHNPITWDINGGLIFDDKAKQEIFTELEKDYISGITLSGGDPLHPSLINEVAQLIKEIKVLFPNKTIWLYTGYDFEDIKGLSFIKDIDVIVDGKFIISLLDKQLHWRGSSNQRVIDVNKTLKSKTLIHYTQ